MKVVICKDYQEMSNKAYDYIFSVMEKNNFECILGLATGSTPIGLYKNMVADFKAGKVSYKKMKSVNLDEYIGLPTTHEQSYCYFMRDNLFDYIDIDKKNYHLPQGNTTDNEKACADYTALLSKMQQDVQVLGLGSNGHIGFNEPYTPFDSVTHIVELTDNTRKDNARFFANISEVPTQSITMGIANIMNAKSVLVLASGESKAKAIKAMIEGEVAENVPASVLQKHKEVVVIIDEAAASLLTK